MAIDWSKCIDVERTEMANTKSQLLSKTNWIGFAKSWRHDKFGIGMQLEPTMFDTISLYNMKKIIKI